MWPELSRWVLGAVALAVFVRMRGRIMPAKPGRSQPPEAAPQPGSPASDNPAQEPATEVRDLS